MGKKIKKVKYDEVKGVAKVKLAHKDYKFVATGSVKVHEDDKDFQTKAVGVELAQLKAEKEYYKKIAIEQEKEAARLRQRAQTLDETALINRKLSLDADKSFTVLVEAKDELYKKLRSNRENGGYKPISFEAIKDVSKSMSEEQMLKNIMAVLEGQEIGIEQLKKDKD